MAEKKKRYLLVDGIRGFAVVNMVLFHLFYDINVIYERNPFWYRLPWVVFWQQCICWTFILVTGFVWCYGKRRNLFRGLFLNICGFGITLVTWLAAPEEIVWFGILNFIGCAIWLMFPLEKGIKRVPPVLGSVVSFLLFICLKKIDFGYLGLGEQVFLRLPEELYKIKVLTPFGFPYPGFSSSDYFPVLPWMLLFVTGYFLQRIFEKQKEWQAAAQRSIPVLSWLGQKSIWIYLIHQPVVMLLCEVLL